MQSATCTCGGRPPALGVCFSSSSSRGRWCRLLGHLAEDQQEGRRPRGRRVGRARASERAARSPLPAAPERRGQGRGRPREERLRPRSAVPALTCGVGRAHPGRGALRRSRRCQGTPPPPARIAGPRRFRPVQLPKKKPGSPGPRRRRDAVPGFQADPSAPRGAAGSGQHRPRPLTPPRGPGASSGSRSGADAGGHRERAPPRRPDPLAGHGRRRRHGRLGALVEIAHEQQEEKQGGPGGGAARRPARPRGARAAQPGLD